MLTQKELAAIRERAERATEGPWSVYYGRAFSHERFDSDGDKRLPTGIGQVFISHDHWDGNYFDASDEDIEFIAHAREDIPKLLAEIERLQRLVTAMDDVGEFRFGYAVWNDLHEEVNERLESAAE